MAMPEPSTSLRDTMQLALDALRAHDRWCGYRADAPGDVIYNRAVDALADALAQLEPPPTHALYGPGGVPSTSLREAIARAIHAADEQYDHDHYGHAMVETMEQSGEADQYLFDADAVLRVTEPDKAAAVTAALAENVPPSAAYERGYKQGVWQSASRPDSPPRGADDWIAFGRECGVAAERERIMEAITAYKERTPDWSRERDVVCDILDLVRGVEANKETPNAEETQ
jgi:hypothetical protein